MRLGELGEKAAPAVPELIWALDHPNKGEGINVADAMVSALGEIGPKAADAVPALIRYLEARKTAWHGPWRAIIALGKVHSRPDLSIPALLQALDELKSERHRTAHALARFGIDAAPAVPAIIRLLEAPDVPADYEILAYVDVLRAAGPSAKNAVPVLARLLSHPEDVQVRVDSARALGAIGSDARSALPALESALRAESSRHPEDDASPYMREAITTIGGSPNAR
jgi:HEAT repeat protein